MLTSNLQLMLEELFANLSEAEITDLVRQLAASLSSAKNLTVDFQKGQICSAADPSDCITIRDWFKVALSSHAMRLISLAEVWKYRNLNLSAVDSKAEKAIQSVAFAQKNSTSCWAAANAAIYNVRHKTKYGSEKAFFEALLPAPENGANYFGQYLSSAMQNAAQLARLYQQTTQGYELSLHLYELAKKNGVLRSFCKECVKDHDPDYTAEMASAALALASDLGFDGGTWMKTCMNLTPEQFSSGSMEYASFGERLQALLKAHKYLVVSVPMRFIVDSDPELSTFDVQGGDSYSRYPLEYYKNDIALNAETLEMSHQIILLGISGTGLQTKLRYLDPADPSLIFDASYFLFVEWQKAKALALERRGAAGMTLYHP